MRYTLPNVVTGPRGAKIRLLTHWDYNLTLDPKVNPLYSFV